MCTVDRLSFENCIIREQIVIYHGSSMNITQTEVINICVGTFLIQFVTSITINESMFVNTGAIGVILAIVIHMVEAEQFM